MVKKYSLIFSIFFLFSFSIFAEGISLSFSSSFDVIQANKQLDDLNLTLATEELELVNLENASRQIKRLYEQAEHCVSTKQEELAELNAQLELSSAQITAEGVVTVDRAFLQSKSNELTSAVAECRLFILRSDDAIEIYDKKIQQLIQQELYTAQPTFWHNLQLLPQFLNSYQEQLDSALLHEFVGDKQVPVSLLWLFIVFIIAGFYIGFKSQHKVLLSLKTLGAEQYYSPLKLQTLNTYKTYSIALWTLIPAASIFVFWSLVEARLYLLSYVAISVSVYLLTMFFSSLMFYGPTLTKKTTQLPNHLACSLLLRLRLLLILSFLVGMIYLFLLPQPIDAQIKQVISTTLFSILTLNMLSLALLLPDIVKVEGLYKRLYSIIILVAIVVLNMIEWLGYHSLSHHLLYAGLMSIILSTLMVYSHKLLSYFFNFNHDTENRWLIRIYEILGIKSHKIVPEVIAMRLLSIFFIWLVFFVSLVKIWDISDQDFYLLLNTVFNGFHLFGMEIIPAKIILAVTLFIILMLLTRFTKQFYLSHSRQQIHKGAKEAIATIIGYIGVGFALVIALIVAGINFTGIALVLGGLSVGVGLGLQNIVNNFVSGIILLIERPIKLGDRIVVGDTEGFVKKISIRSTQISTLQRSDVIVPNSELIANQVTNLMFKDDLTRISVSVGVAYGSNTDLVKQLLMQVAKENENVIFDNDTLKPVVLFKEFGDSSLVFDLWCIIRNVNHKYIISSDIHFAIDKAFRQHDIVIAFPQRDLHIKNWQPENKTSAADKKGDE